jgi:ferrochelatase
MNDAPSTPENASEAAEPPPIAQDPAVSAAQSRDVSSADVSSAEASPADAVSVETSSADAPIAAPATAPEGAPAPASESVPPIAPSPTLAPAPSPARASEPAPPASDVAAAPSSGIGVLLVNLGTPEAATPESVRQYLKEFLGDKRVIEKESLLWKLVLNGFILPFRSRRKARDYRKIWNNENDESPIKTITRAQAEKLATMLEPLGKHVLVNWAMRYGEPSIASRLQAFLAWGCDRVLIMPLYPQYAAATTATVCDEVFRFMMRQRRQPAIRILPPYYQDPCYIEVLASSLKAELKALPFRPDVIVASFHGLPKECSLKGDPYESHCQRTTQLLREQLGLDESELILTYQSRFGRAKWLEPYTIRTMKTLAKKGVKSLVVIMPGFAADCLETLEEIAGENAHVFKRYGGKNFAAIPCLNDSEPGMLMIRQLAMRELKGWV